MACSRQQLSEFLDNLLEPERFQDYCPNGLQVEGKNEIHRFGHRRLRQSGAHR